MKAIIVDIHDKYAVALDKDGGFTKIRKSKEMKIGYEVEIPAARVVRINKMRKITAVAASFLLVVSLGAASYAYTIPYSYINIDINPSVEITTNIYNRIINAEALNDDGIKILFREELKNKTIEDGIEKILDNAQKEGYISEKLQNAVMITVSGRDKSRVEEIKKDVEVKTKEELDQGKLKIDILVEKVNVQRHDDARLEGISPGKMLLIERLKEISPEVEVDEYKNVPVRDIMKSIKDGKKEEKLERKEAMDKKGEVESDKKNSSIDKKNTVDKDSNEQEIDKKDNKTPLDVLSEDGNNKKKTGEDTKNKNGKEEKRRSEIKK